MPIKLTDPCGDKQCDGKPQKVKKWTPETERQRRLEAYAVKLKDLRGEISQEMLPFLNEDLE